MYYLISFVDFTQNKYKQFLVLKIGKKESHSVMTSYPFEEILLLAVQHSLLSVNFSHRGGIVSAMQPAQHWLQAEPENEQVT